MSRPVVFDYDPVYDEEIVTQGIEGFSLTQGTFLPEKPMAVFVLNKGVLAGDGLSLETVTKRGVQYNLEGAELNSWYLANKQVIDDFLRVCFEKAAELDGTTGTINEA